MSSDVDEYNKMRKHAGAVATLLDQNRLSVEGVADLYRRSTLDYLYGHEEELDAANKTVLQAARVLRGSGRFLDDDVNKSIKQLSQSLGNYKQMLMDILKGEPDAVTLASGRIDGREQTHTSTSERVRETVRKPNKVREQLIKMAQQITEMQVLAVEMLYKDGPKDVDVALLVASSRVPDESDDRRKERLQREKQEQEEREKKKKEAEEKKRQELEEQLKIEEQKRKEQEKERLKQELKVRKQKEKQDELDEERKRNAEKKNELERQKKEAERLKREKREKEEEERRNEELEKKKIAEDKQRAADELKRAEEAEKKRLRLKEKRKQNELRDKARRKKAEEDRIQQEEIDKVRAEKERLEEEERQRELEKIERLRREQELIQEEEERKRKEEELRRLKEKQLKEEEERLKRDEKRRKKAAELEKKKEEEALRLKEEEDTRRKADQTKWPIIKYELEEEDDKLGSGIASIVRTCPVRVSLRKEQLQCTSVDWRVNRYPVGDHEELVSTMICLRPTDGNGIELEKTLDRPETNYRTAWIALPLAVVPRDREAVIRVQLARPPTSSRSDRNRDIVGLANSEADIVIEPTTEWSDVTTREAIIEGLDNVCFVETPVKRIDSGGINLVVVTRPKRDDAKWGERGGRVVSSVDPLVSVSAPKNAFQDTARVSLQVFIIDAAVIYGLKERYNGCDMLLGASPMVCVNASSQPLKPLTMSVTSPSGGSKKAAKSAAGSKNGDIEGIVSVMIKDTAGKWRHRNNITLEQNPDHVVFDFVDVTRRLILLRTPPAVDSDELCMMATCLETSLNDRPAQLVVRQREDDPSSVYVELCRRDAVDRLINGERLRSLGYTTGPGPSRLVCLREGDLVEMSFRDNIEPIDKTDDGREIPSEKPVRRFIFNSKITSINAQMFVRERSRFEQNTLQEYRGYVRLCLVERPYAPPPRVAGPYGISDGTVKRTTAAPKAATTQDDHLLCEVAVNLPKKVKEKGYTRINRVNFEIRRNGPLTSEYYDELSAQLGAEWVRLAETLGLTQATIQRIIGSHAHLADSSESTRRSARGVLVQWHRDSVSSRGKVEMLIEALKEAGRDDLAASLKAKNNDYRKNFDQKKEEERLKKAMKIFTDSVPAVRAWREIGRELGLTVDDLGAIGGPAAEIKQFPASKTKNVLAGNSAEMQQHAEKMLKKWIEMSGDEATTSELVEVLKYLKLNDIAEKLMVIQ